jgi:hypothetical protein
MMDTMFDKEAFDKAAAVSYTLNQMALAAQVKKRGPQKVKEFNNKVAAAKKEAKQ